MRISIFLALVTFGFSASAFECLSDGRAEQLVTARSGLEILEIWAVDGSEIHSLKLPNGFDAGVLVEPLTQEMYRERFPEKSQVIEMVKITVFDVSNESPEEVVVGWGGANSWQGFKLKPFGPGGLNLMLTKPVCVKLDANGP